MVITASYLRSIFGMDVTSADTVLGDLIGAAQAAAQMYCGTVFESSTITEYYDGDGTGTLLVKNIPIISVTSLHDDVDRVFGSDDLIDSSDYVLDENTGEIELLSNYFTIGDKNIKVVYIAGYATVPTDIKIAIANLAWASYIEANGGINAIQGQDFVYKPAKLRAAAYEILDRYKKYR